MSKENREVMYGLDKPSGGFYVTEFLRDDEVEKTPEQIENKEIVDYEERFSEQGLTLTELDKILFREYSLSLDLMGMVREWTNAADPTPLQYNVNKMFGKDLTEMLSKVQMDLFHNFSYL
jgi:hypothetical protein